MSRGDYMRLKEIRKSKGISQLKMAIDLNTNCTSTIDKSGEAARY